MHKKEFFLYFVITFFACLSVYALGQRDKYQFAYELAREFTDYTNKNSNKRNSGLICSTPHIDNPFAQKKYERKLSSDSQSHVGE